MNNTIYVTGHRHPDSDAICASIAYTDLLNRTGQTAVACRQGPLNEETKFILKRFGLENPLLMTDARAMLSDIDMDKPTKIHKNETVHHAWHVMLHTQNKSLFVVDDDDKLCGLCSTSDLSRIRTDSDLSLHRLMSTASLEKIARTIGGEIRFAPDEFSHNGIVHIITVQEWELSRFDLAGGISILSSDEDMQKKLIEIGARCLVITCGQTVSNEVVELAREKGCGLITTEQDTMHTAKVITESYSISQVMTRNVMSFNQNEYVEDVAAKMANTRVRSYPVLDDEGYIVGAISRYHTRSYNRRKIALVDHSAVNQSIGNIDKAQIVAIVDHHHIGNIQTDLPIEYRNHRCGCTCTIISKLYKENGLLPDAQISGIMMSAILSDTLNFRSATTTDEDRQTVRWLAARAGITDIDAYAREMLGASVALKDSTPHEILNRDLKNYEIGKHKIAIGQTNYNHIEDVQKLLPEFRANMEQEQVQKNLDLLVMLFTDVMGEGSQFVFYGPLSYVMKDIVETIFDEHSGFDPNIISRKQQMMPKLSQLIKEI